MAGTQQQYITPEMKAKLETELQALIDNRPKIAAEINERREEGDLKENAGYDAAREQQDQEEARIKQISEILSNSTTERAGIVEGVATLAPSSTSTTTATRTIRRPSSSVPAPPPPTTRTWRPIRKTPRWAPPWSELPRARPAPTRPRTAGRFR